MPFVYKYVGKSDNKPKYIGISKTENTLQKRIKAHYKDSWHWDDRWEIYILKVDTLCDAEMLEGHFIAMYGTDEFYNKAKTGWGSCSYLKDATFEWVNYDDFLKTVTARRPGEENYIASFEIDGFKERLSRLENNFYELESKLRKLKFILIGDFFRDCLSGIPLNATGINDPSPIDKESLMEMFEEWCESIDEAEEHIQPGYGNYYIDRTAAWMFKDEDELLEMISQKRGMSPFVYKNSLHGYTKKGSCIDIYWNSKRSDFTPGAYINGSIYAN